MADKAAKTKGTGPGAGLVLIGGRKPSRRKASKANWTKAKERAFVEALAETCNVTAAAGAAGMSVSSVYRRRRSNAAFRASWAEAIGIGYQKLEMAMLERALNGTEKIVTRRDRSEERVREYPNQIAMGLLKMHRDSAMEALHEPDPQEVEELRERLFEKLERLRLREEARGQSE